MGAGFWLQSVSQVVGPRAVDLAACFWGGRASDALSRKMPSAEMAAGTENVPVPHTIRLAGKENIENAPRQVAEATRRNRPGQATCRLVTTPAGAARVLDIILSKPGVVQSGSAGVSLRASRADVWAARQF